MDYPVAMSDRVDAADGGSPPADEAGTSTIEAYETDRGVVLYDADNPLAWVEADHGIPLSKAQ